MRVGNAASEQLQLDVYGEVADALLHAHTGGIQARQTDMDLLTALTEHLATIWEQPDEGIWEVRGGRKQFTYSKVMAWVAFDRYDQKCRTLRTSRDRPPEVARVPRQDPRRSLPRSLESINSTASPKATDRKTSTPRCCCCRWWDFFP